MGFKVAIDDLGAGYSGLRRWADLRPEFVKIDLHFTQGIDCDPWKRQFLQSILEVSRSLGCQVIAEGVETAGEYRTLSGLKCSFFQGYLFARPTDRPATVMDHVLAPADLHRPEGTHTAKQLCTYIEPLEKNALVAEVSERFKKDSQLRCIPVVDEGIPLAVVWQHEFLKLIASPFSHSLYARKRVMEFLHANMIVVQEDTPLELLSQMVTEASTKVQQDFLIVSSVCRWHCSM